MYVCNPCTRARDQILLCAPLMVPSGVEKHTSLGAPRLERHPWLHRPPHPPCTYSRTNETKDPNAELREADSLFQGPVHAQESVPYTGKAIEPQVVFGLRGQRP